VNGHIAGSFRQALQGQLLVLLLRRGFSWGLNGFMDLSIGF
jgi:hypothetical protein